MQYITPYAVLFPLSLCQKCDVSKHKVLVASVCPQSLPFFAVKFGLDVSEAAHKLCGFLKSLGELVFIHISVFVDLVLASCGINFSPSSLSVFLLLLIPMSFI